MYIPPTIATQEQTMVSNYLISNIDNCLNKNPSTSFIICGDLNQFDISDVVLNCSLSKNLINSPTRGSNILDYFLVSQSLLNTHWSVEINSPISTSDHNSVVVTPSNHTIATTNFITTPVFDFRQSNIDRFCHELSIQNWNRVYQNISINEKCAIFFDLLNKCVNTIPKEEIHRSPKDKPWITPKIKFIINKQWSTYKTKNFLLYNHYKNKCKTEISNAKKAWSNRFDKKNVWNKVKEINPKKTNNITQLYDSYNNPFEASQHINQTLSSVFSDPSNYHADIPDSQSNSILPHGVPVELVNQILKRLNPKKAYGSDSIPTICYILAADYIDSPLTHIIACCFEKRFVPRCLKIADVIVFPKTNPPDILNLRPISLLPTPAKVFEKVLLYYTKEELLKHYDSYQFGFRPKSSTCTALIYLHDFLTKNLDDIHVLGVEIVAYDFKKAFDKLNHDILITRLVDLNLPNDLIILIQSYLQDRCQRVRIGTIHSNILPVISGVPQGSLLGPFLFCLFVSNLIPINESSRLIKYADDTTLVVPQYDDDLQHLILSAEHENVLNWSSINKLPINIDKTMTMAIPRAHNFVPHHLAQIKFVENIVYLGVTITSSLTWNTHINKIIARANRGLYILRVLKHLCSKDELILIYGATVRSILEYCNPLFIGIDLNLQNKLNRVQNRAHNIVCGYNSHANCFETLKSRRVSQSLKLFSKCLNSSHLLHNIMPTLSNNGNRVIIPYSRTTRRAKSFIVHSSLLYNQPID